MKNHFTNTTIAVSLLTIGASLCAQPVPHHFSGISKLADGTVTLGLDGSVFGMFNLTGMISNQFMQMFDLYSVESSSDLRSWEPLAWVLRTNCNFAPLLMQDTKAIDFGHRFYRVFTNHLLTPFPKPTGRFAVGTADRVMMDPARTNRYRYFPATNSFMVTFWYPAELPPAGVLPARMWDRRLAADTTLWTAYDPRWATVFPSMVGHRFKDIAIARGPDKYPVVLSSHGLPSWRKLESQNNEELASHGYVVLALDHSDCWATEFPDGQYLAGNHSGDVSGRLKDMTFLLDTLAELNASDPVFAGRLDLARIGVHGGSYGGMVVKTCADDPRVNCALLYDATNIRSLCPNGLQKPFLVALGESNSYYTEDLWLFNQAITNAVFLQLKGADHFTPCDIGWTLELPGGPGPITAYNACALWFFDTYLKGGSQPFPDNPQIYNVHKK